MDKRHIIRLQGRDFVTYEGLLDEAHTKGLASIRTTLVQVPSEANDHTAICTAEITLEDGRVFTGIGDANPKNVNRNIAAHTIRMAETRAKARGLRDAINVGMTSIEELDDVAPAADRQEAKTGKVDKAALSTKAQIDKISVLMKKVSWSAEKGRAHILQRYGVSSRLELTKTQASEFIDHLEGIASVGQEV